MQNEYVENFIDFLQFSGCFELRITTGKIKNMLNKLSTEYNLLPERVAHGPRICTRKRVHKQKRQHNIETPIYSSLLSESENVLDSFVK